MYRTVELTCKAKDLSEVLSKLKSTEQFKENAAFTLQVEIEDVKENYEYLCKSDKILGWDFTSNNREEQPGPNPASHTKSCGCGCKAGGKKENPVEEAINVVSGELEERRSVKTIREALGSIDFVDISNILVSTWINLRKNLGLKFSSLFFREVVVPYIKERRKDPDNTLIGVTLFIKTFYENAPCDDVLKHFLENLRKNWERVKTIETLPALVGELFGPSEEVKKFLGLC